RCSSGHGQGPRALRPRGTAPTVSASGAGRLRQRRGFSPAAVPAPAAAVPTTTRPRRRQAPEATPLSPARRPAGSPAARLSPCPVLPPPVLLRLVLSFSPLLLGPLPRLPPIPPAAAPPVPPPATPAPPL